MPSPRELIWFEKAVTEYATFLKRRRNDAGIRECVETNLLAVAADDSLAIKWKGPGELLIYRFHCDDTTAGVYVQAVLQLIGADKIAVLACNTVLF